MERDIVFFNAKNCRRYFNSHAHVERDLRFSSTRAILRISTHTLTWSVTCPFCGADLKHRISTHTLTWSVTLNFGQNVTVYVISTHTLTWSVTSAVCYAWFIWEISTHTLTWSVTEVAVPCKRSADFNSHAHVERDQNRLLALSTPHISTHTLTWSVTVIPSVFLNR